MTSKNRFQKTFFGYDPWIVILLFMAHSLTACKHRSSEHSQVAEALSSEEQGVIRNVTDGDRFCLAWFIGEVILNEPSREVFWDDPQKLHGSRLIAITSQHRVIDYSQDLTAAGKKLNGVWAQCPLFRLVTSGKPDGSITIRTLSIHTLGATDGNGTFLAASQGKKAFCATEEHGFVLMQPCQFDNSRQLWLWDRGQNDGYGYIKLAQNPRLCMDINQGIQSGQPLLVYTCKPFTPGPMSPSNNQRFWFDKLK